MQFEKTQTSYAIPVDKDAFAALLSYESAVPPASLSGELDLIEGVSRTNYDGHFGSFIFLTIDVENDTKKTRDEITRIIRRDLNWAVRNRKD